MTHHCSSLPYFEISKVICFLSVSMFIASACTGSDESPKNNQSQINLKAKTDEGEHNVTSGSARKLFADKIIPIFEERCGVSCHAISSNSYQQFLEEDPINKIAFYFPFDSKTGRVKSEDISFVYKVAVGHGRIDYQEEAIFSHLLRAPLAQEFGGQPHRGLDIFYSTDDEDYKQLASWIALEINDNKKEKEVLPENVAYFEKNILGVMERNSCFLSSCHDSQVFNDLKLIAPIPSDDIGTATAIQSGFSREMVLANRKAVLGNVARLVNLGGDLTKSRVITKNLPISKGGIHQRGGNIQFFESIEDQDTQHFLTWLELEKKALSRKLTSDNESIKEGSIGKIKGIVFIRGPKHSPRTWFSFDEFYPGADIFLLSLKGGESLEDTRSKPVNLTAQFHHNPVEIQSVDVRYDTKKIVFSMRTSLEKGFRLYELRLSDTGVEGELEQVSFADNTLDDGTMIHHIDPIYMPGPADRKGYELGEVAIKFASNEAGSYAQSDAWGMVGEADNIKGRVLFDKQRPEKVGYFNGRRIAFVDGPNKGEWRTIVEHKAIGQSKLAEGSGARLVLDRSLSKKISHDSIYVIENDKALLQSSFDIWRFVPHSVEISGVKQVTHEGGHQADIGHDVDYSSSVNLLNGLSNQQRFEQSLVQMTYTHAQERKPSARSTGETMFTSVRNIGYQGDKPVFNGAIYRMQAGGFDYHIQGGNRSKYPLYSDSREMGTGLEVRQVHDPRNLWGGGLITLADHGFGINAERDNPMDDTPYSEAVDSSNIPFSSPPRFIPAQANFFKEFGADAVTHTGVSPGGSVRDPYPLLNGGVLVSYTPHSLDHLDENADPDWDLYTFTFDSSPHTDDGLSAGAFTRKKISAASSSLAEYSARPLMVRLKEKTEAPIHHQKFGSRSSTIKPKEKLGVLRMPDDMPAEIECYDYPLLQSFLTNFAPVGSKDFHLQHDNPNGEITPEDRLFKYVRILMEVPNKKIDLQPIHASSKEGDPFASSVSLGVHTKRVIVAELPIEDDGSFYVEVPTNVPLIVQGLNSEKMAMHSMNRWVYLQPGEKLTFAIPRTIYPLRCAGCHGSLTGDPMHGVGPADLVSASSRVMATWNFAEGKRRTAYGFNRGAGEYIGVDFKDDVQPILNQNCMSCHVGKGPAGLDLRDIPTEHYNIAYESLHQLSDSESGNYADKKYINEREALSSESKLITSIMGERGEKHLQGKYLTNEQRLTLIRWIDLGATYKGAKIASNPIARNNRRKGYKPGSTEGGS